MASNFKTLVRCIYGPRLYTFYKFTGRTLTTKTPEVQNESPSDLLLDPMSPLNESNKFFLDSLAVPVKRSYNFAAYVNDSPLLQELVKLGVSLFDIENTNYDAARYLLKLDFETDCAPHIKFLVDKGLKPKNLGRFLSEHPAIFKEPIDELESKMKYFRSRGFSKLMIAKALNRSSHIISHPVKTIDFKLAEFQIQFQLESHDVRDIIVSNPRIIALPKEQYIVCNFALVDEFGFKRTEVCEILKKQSELLEIARFPLIERLELIHNVIGLSHSTIVKFTKLITGPKLDITHRHEYLKNLNRNQYDPYKPLYVPPSALYKPSDLEFCLKYCKTSVEDYKLFLKSS